MFAPDVRLIRPAELPAFPPYVFFGQLFSRPECEALIALGESLNLQPGTIGNGDNHSFREDPSYRVVKQAGITPFTGGDQNWLFERVRDRVIATNRDFFGFHLHGLWENINFLKYEAAHDDQPAGHYRWHQDYGGGYSSHRKLSIIIQLSPPQAYEGCRLKMFTDCEFDPDKVMQGDMIIFPSWASHCVTPITRGTRYALVSWIHGPRFQ